MISLGSKPGSAYLCSSRVGRSFGLGGRWKECQEADSEEIRKRVFKGCSPSRDCRRGLMRDCLVSSSQARDKPGQIALGQVLQNPNQHLSVGKQSEF